MKNLLPIVLLAALLGACSKDNAEFGPGDHAYDPAQAVTFATQVVAGPLSRSAADASAADASGPEVVGTTETSQGTLCLTMETGPNLDGTQAAFTRGTPITGAALLPTMGVYCAYTGAADWTAAANPDKMYNVRMDNSAGTWSYNGGVQPNYYWQAASLTDRYSFFAYAPFGTAANGIAVASLQSAAGIPTVTYTVPATCADQPDLMVATPRYDLRPTGADVALQFSHALTCIEFTVKGDGLAIKGITVKGVKNTGTLALDGGAITWTATSGTANFAAGITAGITPGETATTLTTASGYLMMIPQTLPVGAKLTLTLSNNSTMDFDLGGHVWNEGDKVSYNITLDSWSAYRFVSASTTLASPYYAADKAPVNVTGYLPAGLKLRFVLAGTGTVVSGEATIAAVTGTSGANATSATVNVPLFENFRPGIDGDGEYQLHHLEDLVDPARNPDTGDYQFNPRTIELQYLRGDTWTSAGLTLTQAPQVYVGRFAGDLKTYVEDGITYYQYERELWVQGANEPTSMMWSQAMGTFLGPTVTSVWNGKLSTYNMGGFSATQYPAVTTCYAKNTGNISSEADLVWYLPSQRQLVALWTVQNAFDAYKYTATTSSYYWSVTESSDVATCYVNFNTGSMSDLSKNNTSSRVRCVRDNN